MLVYTILHYYNLKANFSVNKDTKAAVSTITEVFPSYYIHHLAIFCQRKNTLCFSLLYL